MATKVTRNPSPGPKNLRIERATENDGFSVKAIWGNPADALSDSNHKWSNLDGEWTFQASSGMSKGVTQQRGSEGRATGDHVWVRDRGIHEDETVWINKDAYHPKKEGRYLTSITADIYPMNGVGKGEHAKCTFKVEKPLAPEVEMEFDEESKEVSWTVTQQEAEGNRFVTRTRWRVTREASPGLDVTYSGKEEDVYGWTNLAAGGEQTITVDLTAWARVTPGEWIRVTLYAVSQGPAGDSTVTKKVHVHSYPPPASIYGIVASSLWPDGVLTIYTKTNATANLPTDKVYLERLANVSYRTAATAALADGWDEVGEDDGQCWGMTDLVANAMPDVKKRTWYRLRCEHSGFTQYSLPYEAACLYNEKTMYENDTVRFVDVAPDGESIACTLGWWLDDSDAVEISWSEFEDAWESTEQPQSFVVTWQDPEPVSGYYGTCSVTVRGLEEGRQYYLRARRVQTEEDSHGPWATPSRELYPVTTAAIPSDVILSAPMAIAWGSGIDVSWTYSGGTQTAWNLYYIEGDERRLLTSGEGSEGGCTVDADTVPDGGSVRLVVSVTCGGEWVDSNVAEVGVAVVPTMAVAVATVEAQPLTIGLSSDCSTSMVMLTVLSRGVSGHRPGGYDEQVDGDVIWSAYVEPEWVSEGALFGAVVTAPDRLPLRDGGSYELRASITDRTTMLTSYAEPALFTVSYAHQATCPSQDSLVTPIPEERACEIVPVAPEGAAGTDVCDVYRVTPDGSYLIAGDVPFGTKVKDPWAPYGDTADLFYRLCTRTADGDEDFIDIPYVAGGKDLRIDFGGSFVELPYNVSVSDAWAKGFEARAHMDGTVSGYWDESVNRTANLSTDLIKVDGEQARRVRELASHPGPCFVRTPEGCAYMANVDVSGLDRTYASSAVAVSLTATEVALTDEYRIPVEGWDQGD